MLQKTIGIALVRLLLLPLLTAGSAPGQQAFAVEVGEGPLVCLSTSVAGESRRVDLHVNERDGDRDARRFWQNRGNVDVLARLDRDRLLLASYGDPYALLVVDLAAGRHRVLADGCPHGFVAVHGDEVLFLGDARRGKNDDFLYAVPWAAPDERRRLAPARFGSVPLIDGNRAFGVTAGRTEVWVISLLRAQGRRLFEVPAKTTSVRLACSPGAQRLAVGCTVHGRGHLAVVDIGAGTLLRSWSDLPIGVSPLSSSLPTLEVGWYDDTHVVCSESRGPRPGGLGGEFTFVRRSLTTGEVTDEHAYGPAGLRHGEPAPPEGTDAARPDPMFWVARVEGRSDLMQDGVPEPLASFARGELSGSDLAVAPDGRAAIARLGEKRRRPTLFRPNREPLQLCADYAYDFRWLPAATVPTPGSRR